MRSLGPKLLTHNRAATFSSALEIVSDYRCRLRIDRLVLYVVKEHVWLRTRILMMVQHRGFFREGAFPPSPPPHQITYCHFALCRPKS